MNPLDPNTQNNSSVPTSPVPNGQGAVNGAPTPVQPGAVFHPPTATDQISAAQASPAPGVDNFSAPVAPNPISTPPVSSVVDLPTATQSTPVVPETPVDQAAAATSPSVASEAAAGAVMGNNSPLHPEVLAKDLWGGGTPPPEAPEEHVKTPWFKSLWFILLAALFATGLIAGAFFIFGKPSGDTTINNSQVNENYEVTTVPLSDLASDQIITIDNDSQLAINGQLRINNSAVIEATEQPDNPEAGMLWFSSANNTLYYYNGTQFVPMSTSIGGVAGTLSLGGGLSLVNSSIVNSGVISIQGQAGNVDFAAGGGISINGTTITNTGVLGITAGNPNQLSVTSNNGNVSISLAGISAGGVLIGTAGGGIGTALPANPGLCLISNAFNQPEFGSCTGTTTVTSLNGLNNAVTIAAGTGISVTPSGNTLTIANTGGGVSSINTGVGAINIQNASLSGQDIIIDTATTSALGLVSADGTTVLINGSGQLSIGQSVATSANVSFNQLSLSTDLAVSEGGTGASSFAAGGLLVGNGSSPIGVVSALSAGQCLLSGAGPSFTPSFSNCPVGGNISQGSQSGEAQNANRIVKYGVNANTITNSLLTDDGSTVTVTAGDFTVTSGTITGNGSGITNVNAATLQGNPASAFELAISTLPVTKGGTGLNTLTQYGVLVGDGTNNVNPITAGGSGLCFMSNAGMPSFQSCPVGGNLSGSGTDGTLSKFDINGDLVDSLISEATGTILAGGKLIVRDNSADAFVVQQSNLGNQTLVVDTTNNNVGIGFAPTVADVRLQVNGAAQFLVDSGNEPTASASTNGSIYYDTVDDKFKIIEGGVVKDLCNTVNQSCGAGTSDITLQSAYGGGNTILTADARNIAFTLADTATDSNFLVNIAGSSSGKFAVQGAGNDLFSVNTTGAVLGQGGPGGVTGSLSFKNSSNAYTVSLTASTSTSEDYTLVLPTTNGDSLDCLKTNGSGVLSWGTCVAGGSGGGITGSGTLGTIALFTPNGQTLGDSIITQPDADNVAINGNLTVGDPSNKTGQLIFGNASTANTVTLQSSASTGNFTLTLPTSDGGADECLKTDGSGVLSWTACLSGSGSGGGVTDVNGISGAVNILGTTDQVIVAAGGQDITLSLPQSINTTNTPTFAGLNLTGASQLSLGTNAAQAGKITFFDGLNSGFTSVLQRTGAFTGNNTINIPDAGGTLAVSATGNIALSAAGQISFTGQLPVASGGTGAANASSARSNLGAAASGSNSDITALSAVSSVQNSSGGLTVGNTGQTLTLQGGAATKLSAANGSFTSELVFANPTGNATITIPNATGTICLQNSGACGFLTSAVQSLQGQTGALTLTQGTGITINPGSLTITNAGVTSIAGTANQISASAATGGVTLSLPNDVYLGVSTSAAGTLSLWDSDATNRAILQAANLDANRTYTLPNATGTLAVSASGNIALNSTTGDISFTGTLPISSGGTGTTSTPSSGSLLIGNSSNGYSVATLTQGSGVTITNGNGSITIAAPNAGSCSTCANQSLSNLSGTGIATDRVAKLNAAGTGLVSSDIYDTGTAITVGDGADNNQTVKLQGGNTAAAVSIQSLAGGTISVGTDNVANNIQIGNTANAVSQTIGIGNNATASSQNVVAIGSLIGSGSSTTIQGGTGTGAISIQTGASGRINIATANTANTVQIGNTANAVAQTISIGNNATASSSNTITLGSLVGSSTTTIQGGTGSTAVSIQSGAGSTIAIATANTTNTVQIGNTTNATVQTINIGNNTTASSTNLVTLGSLVGSSTTTIQGGTGSSAVSIQSGSAGTIKIGTSGVANTIQLGNTTGAVAQTINIGNNATASSSTTLLMGSAIGTSPVTLASGTSGISASSTADTGTAFVFTASSLTTGNGLSVTASGSSFLSGSQVQVTQAPTYNSDTTNATNLLNLNRSVNLNNAPASITLNNSNTGQTFNNVGNYVSFSITGSVTVNSGNNRYLPLSTHVRYSQSCYTSAATFDGGSQTLTEIQDLGISGGNGYSNVKMFGLAAPNVGASRTFSINMSCANGTGGWNQAWSAMVFNNVNQSSPHSVTTNSVTNSGNFSGSISSDTSKMVVDAIVGSGGVSVSPNQSGQTMVLNNSHGLSSYRAGQASSTAIGWTGTVTNYGQIIVALNRAPTLNTIIGNVATFSSNCSGSGTCADTSNILNLNQQYSSASGSVLKIQNAGIGDSIQVMSGATSAFRITNAAGTEGSALFQNRTDNTSGFRIQGQSNAFIMNADTLNGGLSVTSDKFASAGLLSLAQSGSTTAATISGSTQSISRSVTATGQQTVAIDSGNVSQGSGALSWNHTIGSQSNRAVVVTITGNSGTPNNITSIKFGGPSGTSMTKVGGNFYTALYILPPSQVPASGTYQIVISGVSANQVWGTASTYYNVSASSPYSGYTENGFGGTSIGVPGTTVNDMVVDVSNSYLNVGPISPTSAGQTALVSNYSIASTQGRASYRQGTSGSTTMSWSGATWYYIAGFVLKGDATNTNIVGSLSTMSSNCTATTGTCTDSSNILNLNQQFSGATGAVLAIQNSGTGADIQLSNGTIQTTATNATTTNSVGVSIQSGNATGATSNSGDVTIDSGTATGSTGNVYIGNSNALTVQIGNSNATIGTWANNSGYNLVVSGSQPRMAHGSAVYNGYVYVVGGQSSNSVANAVDTVYYAKLNSDGSIPTTGVGVWAAAGNNLPAKRTFHSVVAANGYLYAIGGMDETGAVQNSVYYAKINSNGTVGAWQTESDTITAVQGHRSVAYNGYLYVVGGSTTAAVTGAVSSVQYARLNADGSTGVWNTTTGIGGSSLVSRYAPGVAVGNGYLYVAGGIDSGSTVQSTVYLAKLKSDGTIDSGAYNATTNPGAWRTTNAIVSGGTQARYGLQLVASNGYLYAFGGNSGSGLQAGVYSAPLVNDGSIGTWSTLRSMTLAANYHQVVAANGYFYTIGGIDGSNAVLNTVYYSSAPRVKVAGSLDLIGSDNIGLSEGGAGGELTAGNTRIVGTFDVSDQANFMQDVKIGGNLTVGGNPTNTNPVFAVQNATGVNAIQVSASNLSLTGINANDTVLRVAMDSVTNRSISAAGYISGLAFNTANGDYAEWIPWSGPKPPAGSVIDYNGAKMVVSSLETAAVIANDKFSDGNSILVAFTGQVSVRVTGQVNAGDILVDNGDGTARAISSSNATLSDYVSRIGTALESGALNGKVLTLIAGPGADASRFSQQANTFADLNVSGSLTTNDLVVMGNATFNGNITVNGHIVTGGGTPLATALSAAGSGATVTIDGNDSAGKITITTGSDPSAGDIGKIDFSSAFSGDAKTNLTPMNGSAAELQYYYSSTNTNFTLKSNNSLAPNTTYIYSYWVVE